MTLIHWAFYILSLVIWFFVGYTVRGYLCRKSSLVLEVSDDDKSDNAENSKSN